MTTNDTLIEAIDELGIVRAKLADLKKIETELKDRLADLAPGPYEGQFYRLSISESQRETPDAVFKARIDELIAEHVSRQFATAHTNITDVRTYRVSARNGRMAA